MYARDLTPPDYSFFLFGPRGTGKSTWLKSTFPHALRVDLISPAESLRYGKDPALLKNQVLARDKEDWIVIDEVQKVPLLLDQVHDLMENHDYQKFILSGSSARKLRRGNANLLAGRAAQRRMFPFTTAEVDFEFHLDQCLTYGMLPLSFNATSDAQREDFLRSYLITYLNEEIKAEGLVRNYISFARFLEVAALAAGTAPNITGLSRDSGIGRDTVEGYFSIFVDTLIGDWLPAYQPRAKVKEVASPKFYWFDPGLLHVAAGGFDQPLPADWNGILLEHFIHSELSSYLHYSGTRGSLGYWGTPATEIDFVAWYGDRIVAIEVKSSKRFRKEHIKGLKTLQEEKPQTESYLVYRGDEILKVDSCTVLPYANFVSASITVRYCSKKIRRS
jgi:predicted AAA+ superfamily ATPase